MTVNAICPGNTLTNMVAGVAARVGAVMVCPRRVVAAARQRLPAGGSPILGKWPGVVALLASQDARYLTGQALDVDGGMVMS